MNVAMKVPMTSVGEKALRASLKKATKKLRGEIAAKIAHAKAFGDLSENAEYKAAKQEQALLMKLTQALSIKLRNSQIIDPKRLVKNGKVVFGTTVYLRNTLNKDLLTFQIVGEDEADIKAEKISFKSPIARSIIGKKEGDFVEVSTLEGMKSFTIEKVEYH
jgi:transcription elongation factor GreA